MHERFQASSVHAPERDHQEQEFKSVPWNHYCAKCGCQSHEEEQCPFVEVEGKLIKAGRKAMLMLAALLALAGQAVAQNYLVTIEYELADERRERSFSAVCLDVHTFLTVAHPFRGINVQRIRVNLDGNFYEAQPIRIEPEGGPDLALLYVPDGKAFRRSIELAEKRPELRSKIELRSSLHGPAQGWVVLNANEANCDKTPLVEMKLDRNAQQGDSGSCVFADGKCVGIMQGGSWSIGNFVPCDYIRGWMKRIGR